MNFSQTGSVSIPVSLADGLKAAAQRVLTSDALDFVARLHRRFNPTRLALLERRRQRQAELDRGARPGFLSETRAVRGGSWSVAPAPADLNDRRVEITGPVERKMMINALNSGAKVFMADIEDSLAPTWSNVIHGQINLMDAVRRTIEHVNPEGKRYRLSDRTATLVVRPRGWHMTEKHMLVDGEPISASLFDFGLCFFHNAHELIRRGSGPYFYLPKLENHLEARLWNDVFIAAQDELGIGRGTIRATVLIETILGAFEMEEILHELREHAAGLNAGRWDYIFSIIKKFRNRADCVLPDRAQVTMTVPFMRAYTQRLVQVCHRRGAHAIGGMAAFIPNRRDPEINTAALAKVREDKLRESADGFDGTWVAHPDLVPTAMSVFDAALGPRPHQKDRLLEDLGVQESDLTRICVPGGRVTEAGLRLNVSIALQYLDAWLGGNGAAAINNLMEDAATAEISRAQIWQWIRHGTKLADGRTVTTSLYQQIRKEELGRLAPSDLGHLQSAAEILDGLIMGGAFADFLTVPAYALLE
jgi:malate synthase